VYQICDRPWRGLGIVPQGGLALRETWSQYDALHHFSHPALPAIDSTECRSGEVLTGQIKPVQCEHFAGRCTPEQPLGAPMVSAEGACAAYYRYTPPRTATPKS
jgi:hydrogenase expression/formation protein HypD